MVVMKELILPSQHDHSETMAILESQSRTMEWTASMASGGFSAHLNSIVDIFQSDEFLRVVGFIFSCDNALDPDTFKEDEEIVVASFYILIGFLWRESEDMRFFRSSSRQVHGL